MTETAAPQKSSGVLRPWQRRLYRLLLIPLGLIAANAIYLYGFTRDTIFFYSMLLLHLVLGIAIAIAFFVFAVTHAKRMIRMWNKRAKYAGLLTNYSRAPGKRTASGSSGKDSARSLRRLGFVWPSVRVVHVQTLFSL